MSEVAARILPRLLADFEVIEQVHVQVDLYQMNIVGSSKWNFLEIILKFEKVIENQNFTPTRNILEILNQKNFKT